MRIKDTIYALESMKKTSVNSFHKDALDMAIEGLKEQKTGKWIMGKYRITCNQCRFTYPNIERLGAKMEEQE